MSILYRDNGEWGWFIWRIRYQLIALVANPHKPTSSLSPWTRTWDTSVIQYVPLQDLPKTEFQLFYRMPNASIGIFFFISLDVDKVGERIRVRCHATQDGSWGLTFVTFLQVTAFIVFIAADALWEYIVECLCSADGMLHFFGLRFFIE